MGSPTQAEAAQYLEAVRLAAIKKAHRDDNPALWMQSVLHIRGIESKPYSLARFPYMVEPLQSRAPSLSIMSSSGTGKTEAFMGRSLFRADKGLRQLYAMESDAKVSKIVTERVNPNLNNSKYLAQRCAQADNIGFKMFPEGFIYCMGLGTGSSVTSIHVDDATFDETDLMDQEYLAAAKKRLTTAVDPTVRYLSNPWNEGGGIHAMFLEGDQRLWHVPCPHCKAVNPLDWDTHVDMDAYAVRCNKCFKPLDRLGPGLWVPTRPGGGEPSYHMHGLMSPELKLEEVCKELKSDDTNKVKAAWRFNIGKPYRLADGGLSMTDLKAADGGMKWTKYAPKGWMMVDPGGVFDVQIWQKQDPGSPMYCTWYGTVKGWRELRLLVKESGVAGGLVDFGPENKAALEFCQDMAEAELDFRRIAYTIPQVAGNPDHRLSDKDPLLIEAQRTGAIDQMVADVKKGKLRFSSQVVNDMQGRWALHMRAPSRSVDKDAKGNEKGGWDEGSKADHQFHCSVYASVWSRIENKGVRRKAGVSSWGGN